MQNLKIIHGWSFRQIAFKKIANPEGGEIRKKFIINKMSEIEKTNILVDKYFCPPLGYAAAALPYLFALPFFALLDLSCLAPSTIS